MKFDRLNHDYFVSLGTDPHDVGLISLCQVEICLPQVVKYLAVVPYSEQLIGHGDPVGVGILGVPENGVGQPDEAHHVAVERQDLHGAVVTQTAVGPRLRKDDVDLVFLEEPT